MTTLHNRQRWRAARAEAEPPLRRHTPPDDGSLDAARGIVRALIWSLALWAIGALAVLAVLL